MRTAETFDPFELFAAIVLGLGALCGAWAGYQDGQWGGAEAAAYGEAGKLTSEAAALVTEAGAKHDLAVQMASRDADVDLQAKRLIFEARATTDPELRASRLRLAKYLYGAQLSDGAYAFLGLPAAARASGDGASLTEADLAAAAPRGLGEAYLQTLLGPAEAKAAEARQRHARADERVAEGQACGANADRFALATVMLTACMFFAGIGLVFRTRLRWAFGAVGAAALAGASVHLASSPWM